MITIFRLVRGSEVVVATFNLERSELVDSICQINSMKSPGINGVIGVMCKNIWNSMPEYLEVIFRKCVSEEYPNG